jgi:Leucine-rich repeat (LRR) protein
VETASLPPTSGDSHAQPLSTRRDWIDVTVRLATSWVGLFTAYVVALILALTKFKELTNGLHEVGIPSWLGVALIGAFPLLSLIFSTIPTYIEQHRIKRYGEITGAIKTGYFTLRPREDENGFDRADNAHQEVLHWVHNTKEPVLYLTGASGTGKSSLLSAWVVPKLKREEHVVIQLRAFAVDLVARIKGELLRPGVIWDKLPSKAEDLRTLLDRATKRLGESRLFIIVDQFEEFLVLASQDAQSAFQRLLSEKPPAGVTFLLVYRPEYERLIQDHPWPKLQLDTNRKVVSPFTENAAHEFMRKSGITLNPHIMREVLREAAEIERTIGLIRPITINLCGLVLGRSSSSLPHRFRGGLIRGFLRESLALPEVRDVAAKVIPELISANVTKQPRNVADLARATALAPSSVRACLRRLGESERAIVRPLDREQETWEISHDFLVPLIDSIVARGTISLWRSFRPWLPWFTTAMMGIAAVASSIITGGNPTVMLAKEGWLLSEDRGVLRLQRRSPVTDVAMSRLRDLGQPFSLNLSDSGLTDLSDLGHLKSLVALDLSGTKVTNVAALRELKSLTHLDLSSTKVTDISPLRDLKSVTQLDLAHTGVKDISALRDLGSLIRLRLTDTHVADVSALRDLKTLNQLDLSQTEVADISALRTLNGLTDLNLTLTKVVDISALQDLKRLTELNLALTSAADVSALRELHGLTLLILIRTRVRDVSALRELRSLKHLNLGGTDVTDISALRDLQSLTYLDLSGTKVQDVSVLRQLENLRFLDLRGTNVKDISSLELNVPTLLR